MASNASLRKEPVSFSISGALVWKTMSAAIEFDRQLRDRAVEIEEVDAARIPAAEFIQWIVCLSKPADPFAATQV